MPTFYDIPIQLLHQVLLVAIDSTHYICWHMSLRLVNQEFNEAILYLYFIRGRGLGSGRHPSDCVELRRTTCFCRNAIDQRTKSRKVSRYLFQSLLAYPDVTGIDTPYHRLWRQWNSVLLILQKLDHLKLLGPEQILYYSTCSTNPIFNNVPSAILAQAVPTIFRQAVRQNLISYPVATSSNKEIEKCENYSLEFWIALCACTLDDLQLFQAYNKDLTQSIPWSWGSWRKDGTVNDTHLIFLLLAIKHGSVRIVCRLLQQYPQVMSQSHATRFLKEAIFCKNISVLRVVLSYTPKCCSTLKQALRPYSNLLAPSASAASEAVRILIQHFTPLSREVRAELIGQSCAVGDVTLLEDLAQAESLFKFRMGNAQGCLPSWINYAILYGHHKVVRLLMKHGLFKYPDEITSDTVKQTLMFNHTKCYREMHRYIRHEDMRYEDLGLAHGVADILAECFLEQKRQRAANPDEKNLDPDSWAPYALWNAIRRLRSCNVHFLLAQKVRFRRWTAERYPEHKDPLEISWPYFDKNRAAFARTQKLLDAYKLPKLRVIA